MEFEIREVGPVGQASSRSSGAADHTGDRIDIRSPADGSLVGTVRAVPKEELDEVFDLAGEAQRGWARTSVDERAAILHRAADLLEERAKEIAEILVKEIAKRRKDSVDEVLRSADFIRYTAEEGKRLVGETLFADAFPGFRRDKLGFTYRFPVGIVLCIPPFNYPVNLTATKVAPALVAGNAAVLKPPTQGALSALQFAAAFHDGGVPKDLLPVVTGRGGQIGDALVTHPKVDLISFTGSTATGQRIARQAAMVPLQLELGGKDAAIVLPDADIDLAAGQIVSGAFSYSGQRCTAVKRVLAIASIADRLVQALVPRIRALTVGRPEDDADITPLIDNSAADYVWELVEEATDRGAKALVETHREGNLIWPALLDHVTEDMRVAWEEPFGPVLPVIRVPNAEEAVRIANASEYGLQASIFSADFNAVVQLAARLEVGTVHVNGKTARGPDHFPFIGTKSSGLGIQGARYSIQSMTRVKSLVLNLQRVSLSNLQ